MSQDSQSRSNLLVTKIAAALCGENLKGSFDKDGRAIITNLDDQQKRPAPPPALESTKGDSVPLESRGPTSPRISKLMKIMSRRDERRTLHQGQYRGRPYRGP
jgi:hypothetical protein